MSIGPDVATAAETAFVERGVAAERTVWVERGVAGGRDPIGDSGLGRVTLHFAGGDGSDEGGSLRDN